MSSDYDRLKEELQHKRKTRSYIIAYYSRNCCSIQQQLML